MTIDDLELVDEDWHRELYRQLLLQDLGPAFVMEDESGPMCLCGAVIIWPGVAEVWFRLIRVEHMLSFIKELRRVIKQTVEDFKLWRIQACVEVNFEKGCRLAKCMGFEREAILKKHNYNKADNIMYARLF